MARPESQALAGYYPTPTHLLPSFASILRWPEGDHRELTILDPCAGEGEAVYALRDLWSPPREPTTRWSPPPQARVTTIELEDQRYWQLRARGGYGDQTGHGDALHAVRTAPDSQAAVLYLNPPYDTDPVAGRLEERFLRHFTPWLAPGAGWLMYLVPHYALEASADTLAGRYHDLRCWRLPPEDFAAFRQVLVLGRRSRAPFDPAFQRERILAWAREPELLPELPSVCPDPVLLDLEAAAGHVYPGFLEPDYLQACESFRPWEGTRAGLDVPLEALVGLKIQTALPPKPAHIALALSSGLFNGYRLEPNDPNRHPPVLAKGRFRRDSAVVSKNHDEYGQVTSQVEIERPALEVQLLRLDSYTFQTLQPGVIPSGSDDLLGWNVADLVAHYDRALAEVLARQFPPLHDPRKPDEQLTLPELARKPFGVQATAAQAALKLLASGRNPFLVAEVGTGKSTMALYVAAALSPEHHGATVRQLRALGLTGKLPVVRRTLIYCPPHLLDSWRDQIAAVLPEARVQVLAKISDLDREADFYILSRETAKLGHAYRDLDTRKNPDLRCPRCARRISGKEQSELASHRIRCDARIPRPGQPLLQLAQHLAGVLRAAKPEAPLVCTLAPRKLRYRQPKGGLTLNRLDSLVSQACRVAIRLVRQAVAQAIRGYPDQLSAALRVLELATTDSPTAARCRTFLERLLPSVPQEAGSVRQALEYHLKQTAKPGPLAHPEHLAAQLLSSLERLHELAGDEARPCNEPLFVAIPKPRRYPLARAIQRQWRGRFFLILDEAHEANHSGSAQAKAAHRLAQMPGVRSIVLTGSLMGGYASSVFPNFWHLSPKFRDEFGRDDETAFCGRYGYRKMLRTFRGRKDNEPVERGVVSDREISTRKVIGEAPGIHPTFITRHLLPTAVLVHKEELEIDLPPLTEVGVPISFPACDPTSEELRDEYRRLQTEVMSEIRSSRKDPERRGKLLGALVELPSYLDRATEDQGRYFVAEEVRLAEPPKVFPAEWRTPKELWLIDRVKAALEAGDKVLLFLRHTGHGALPKRILDLLAEVTEKTAWLDAKAVPPAKRQEWIEKEVLKKGVEVLLVNPNAVRTGLNNLVAFNIGLWYELDYATTTYRQANGRLHRIGQVKSVSIEIPYYVGTGQQIAFELVAKKVSVSTQVDGLDLQGALEAAGASEEHAAGVAAAMSLGEAVWRRLGGG